MFQVLSISRFFGGPRKAFGGWLQFSLLVLATLTLFIVAKFAPDQLAGAIAVANVLIIALTWRARQFWAAGCAIGGLGLALSVAIHSFGHSVPFVIGVAIATLLATVAMVPLVAALEQRWMRSTPFALAPASAYAVR